MQKHMYAYNTKIPARVEICVNPLTLSNWFIGSVIHDAWELKVQGVKIMASPASTDQVGYNVYTNRTLLDDEEKGWPPTLIYRG